VRHIAEWKLLVLLQVNCRGVCNTSLEFWNVIDTHKSITGDVVSMESWISEETSSAEFIRDHYKTLGVIGVPDFW
jgi:hypothetical protein